jgi:hypothetical protein
MIENMKELQGIYNQNISYNTENNQEQIVNRNNTTESYSVNQYFTNVNSQSTSTNSSNAVSNSNTTVSNFVNESTDQISNISNFIENSSQSSYSTRISTISRPFNNNDMTQNIKNIIQDFILNEQEKQQNDRSQFTSTDIMNNKQNMESLPSPEEFAQVEPGDTTNINENLFGMDMDISSLMGDINSPPIWRTAMG